MIANVEIPLAIRRCDDNVFFIAPVLLGSVGYKNAAAIFGGRLSGHDLSSWNLMKVPSPALTLTSAAAVAQRALKMRLTALHKQRNPEDSVRLLVCSRRPQATAVRPDFVFDWSSYFEVRHMPSKVWSRRVLPNLNAFSSAFSEICHRQLRRRALKHAGFAGMRM
jgi:hypothetical protein